MDPLDAYELRVKLYAMGWEKSHFASFSESRIQLCRLESKGHRNKHNGAYTEIQLDTEGFIKPGAVYFFRHNSQICPVLKDIYETHRLSAAEGIQAEESIDPYYNDELFPYGKIVLAKACSERGGQEYFFQVKYKSATINGYQYRVNTLLEAFALSAYISLPYRTLDDLERISSLSLAKVENDYQSLKEKLLAGDRS